jgi:hypothetical protein
MLGNMKILLVLYWYKVLSKYTMKFLQEFDVVDKACKIGNYWSEGSLPKAIGEGGPKFR